MDRDPSTPREPESSRSGPDAPAQPALGGWRSWNKLAFIALIIGLAPWWWGGGSLLAMILGIFALRQINRSSPQQRGYPVAIAAVVVGTIGLAGTYIASLLSVPT